MTSSILAMCTNTWVECGRKFCQRITHTFANTESVWLKYTLKRFVHNNWRSVVGTAKFIGDHRRVTGVTIWKSQHYVHSVRQCIVCGLSLRSATFVECMTQVACTKGIRVECGGECVQSFYFTHLLLANFNIHIKKIYEMCSSSWHMMAWQTKSNLLAYFEVIISVCVECGGNDGTTIRTLPQITKAQLQGSQRFRQPSQILIIHLNIYLFISGVRLALWVIDNISLVQR